MNEVCGWVMSAAKIPVWAKLTPNVTSIAGGAEAALSAGVDGVSAINTILSVTGVDLETLRPEPTVEGYSTPGGYSCMAVRPIALRMVKECAERIRDKFPRQEPQRHRRHRERQGRRPVHPARRGHRSGLHGRHEVRLRLRQEDEGRTARVHGQEELRDDRRLQGYSLQFFTTHADLVRRQTEAKAMAKAKAAGKVTKDTEWKGDSFVQQSSDLARG